MLCMGEIPLWVNVGEFQKLAEKGQQAEAPAHSDMESKHREASEKLAEAICSALRRGDFDVTSIEGTDKKES